MTTSRPVRVLYCEQNVDGTIGGSYFSLLYLVSGLDKSRFEPIVVFYREHSLLPAFRAAGARVLVWDKAPVFTFARHLPRGFGWLKGPATVAQKGLNFFRSFVVAVYTRARFLRQERIGIVHLNNSIVRNHDWMLAALLTKRRCLTHERGINTVYPWMARVLGRRLDAVVCISEAVRDNLRQRGVDFSNLVTIPNGLDPEVMLAHSTPAELRCAWGVSPDSPLVVMVGNIKSWKGQDTLVRALGGLRRRQPAIRCMFIGATSPLDEDYERRLRELIRSQELESHVIFTGFQEHVADFIAAADIVVHASVLPEPFGRVLLEAMALRRPIVASRAGGVTEIVAEGDTGLLFPPGDHEALSVALRRLLDDRQEGERMGLRGYERLMSRFHVSTNIASTHRVYERLLGEAD